MSRRIEIELTSARDDGTWTWRAAGAKAPKGTVDADVVPGSSKVGDVLRVDAEFFLDGIQITSVVPPKSARQEPERLELIAPTRADEPLVTSTLTSRTGDDRPSRRDGSRRDASRREGPRREGRGRDGARRDAGPPRDAGPRREGGERSDGPRAEGGEGEHRGRGPRREGERSPRREGERGPRRHEGAERPPRRTRPEPPPMPAVERTKAKRLRPGRVHRTALLESLPEDQRRIAEQVVLGGVPAVRQAIDKQNEERAAAGENPITAGPLLDLAEKLLPRVRTAEWRDRAEAALRDLEHLDLRDLRSVVSAADARTKDPEVRALAEQLRAGLVARVDAEHAAWLEELTATLDVGRIVRALRVSSRPPKAGAPLPAELSARLTTMAGEALTAEAAPERWVAVIDALAFSPVRDKVIPTSLPGDLHPDVRGTIARLATRIPKVAHIFEIEPDPSAPRPKPERRRPPKPKKPKPDAESRAKKPRGPKDGATKDQPASTDVAPGNQAAPTGTDPTSDAPQDPASTIDGPAKDVATKDEVPMAEPPKDGGPPEDSMRKEAATNDAPADDAARDGAPTEEDASKDVAEGPPPDHGTPAAASPAAPAAEPDPDESANDTPGDDAAPIETVADAAAIVSSEPLPAPGQEDVQPAAAPVAAPSLDDDVWVAESSLEEGPGRGPGPPDAAPTTG